MRRPGEPVMQRLRQRYCVQVGTAAADCGDSKLRGTPVRVVRIHTCGSRGLQGPKRLQQVAGHRGSLWRALKGAWALLRPHAVPRWPIPAMQGVWRRLAAIRVPFHGPRWLHLLARPSPHPQATSLVLPASEAHQRCSRRWGRTVSQPARLLRLPDSAIEY